MSKKLVAFLAIFVLFLFGLVFYSSAQVPTIDPAQGTQAWRVLTPRKTSNTTAELTGSGFPVDRDIYLVHCVDTGEGRRCTTGNAQHDLLLAIGGMRSMVELQGPNPMRTTDGNIKVNVKALVADGTPLGFFGVTIGETVLVSGERGDTLQYGTFRFEPMVQTVQFRADPFGRVFDSQSLEPVSGVQVRILDQLSPENLADATPENPTTIGADGTFNFLVFEGTYYLRLKPATHPRHKFTASPNLHPNYTQAYFDLYKPDEGIDEKPPTLEHRDIPLDPGTNQPARSEVVLINYGQMAIGSKTEYGGKISHPLSIVALVGEKSGQEIARTSADNFGFWQITLRNADVPQDEALKVKLIKVDLTTGQEVTKEGVFSTLVDKLLSLISKKASAQTKEAVFPPILRYVEGYAYDKAGNPIGNAEVRVKLAMSDGVYFRTSADENGHFIIMPQYLPLFEYYLEFIRPNTTTPIRYSPTEFVEANRDYLQASNINLMTASVNNQSVVPVAEGKAPEEAIEEEAISPQTQSNRAQLLALLLLILGLTVGGLGLFLYYKKKVLSPDQFPPKAE